MAELRDTPYLNVHDSQNRCRRFYGTNYLLAMDQYILSSPQRPVDIPTGALQMTSQVCTRHIEDINPIALKPVFLCQRQPRNVKDLH